jgi:hypothetical protein
LIELCTRIFDKTPIFIPLLGPMVDESIVPVINDEKHRAVKSYLWVVRSVMKNPMFFYYDKGSRAQKVAIDFFVIIRVPFRLMVMMPTQYMRIKRAFCC